MHNIRFRISKTHFDVLKEMSKRLKLDRKSLFTLLVAIEYVSPMKEFETQKIENSKETEIDLLVAEEILDVFDKICIKKELNKVQCFLNLMYNYRNYRFK